MAVGEAAGPGGRRVVTAGGGKKRSATDAETVSVEEIGERAEGEEPRELVHKADDALEKLLAEEEEIERRTRAITTSPTTSGATTSHVDAQEGPPPQGSAAAEPKGCRRAPLA